MGTGEFEDFDERPLSHIFSVIIRPDTILDYNLEEEELSVVGESIKLGLPNDRKFSPHGALARLAYQGTSQTFGCFLRESD